MAVDRDGPKEGERTVQIEEAKVPGWQSVTIPGKSVEQDSYREGNGAKHKKKLADKPQAAGGGKVKFFNEAKGYGLIDGDGGDVSNAAQHLANQRSTQHDEFDSEDKLSERKGRNPQTGKEIKIPAKKMTLVVTDDEGVSDSAQKLAMVVGEPELPLSAREDKKKNGKDITVNWLMADYDGENTPIIKLTDKESGEEYFVHATGLIDEIRDEDDVSFELREGRKGMNAVDVRRTD